MYGKLVIGTLVRLKLKSPVRIVTLEAPKLPFTLPLSRE